MHLLDQYGADAVRYWSLSARLGTDTAFDEKVLKVGRRLVTKVFNASKFVLVAERGRRARSAHPLDLSFLARLRETVERATAALRGARVRGGPRRGRALLLVAASPTTTSRW